MSLSIEDINVDQVVESIWWQYHSDWTIQVCHCWRDENSEVILLLLDSNLIEESVRDLRSPVDWSELKLCQVS